MRLSALRSFVFSVALLALGCATAPKQYTADFGATSQGRMAGRGASVESVSAGEQAATGFVANGGTFEGVKQHRAMGVVSTLKCVNPPTCTKHKLAATETVWNVKTTAG